MAPAVSCYVTQSTSTRPTLTCNYAPCLATGRRPEGLIPRETPGAFDKRDTAAASYLAEMAWLEAASVPAFDRLTRELEAHGAPQRLREASRRAANDEVRHARQVGAFARAAGAVVSETSVAPTEARSLEQIAVENAVEGCVRETFGAAVAAVQSVRARDRPFRGAMKRIARDEARHARLSWELATWLDENLDEHARRRVEQARERAVDDLLRQTSVEPAAVLAHEFGVPTSTEARAMALSLRASLWTKRASHVSVGVS